MTITWLPGFRRALEIVPIHAAPDVEMRERIAELATHDVDAPVRAAAVEAQRGLEAIDAISAYRPPAASVTS